MHYGYYIDAIDALTIHKVYALMPALEKITYVKEFLLQRHVIKEENNGLDS